MAVLVPAATLTQAKGQDVSIPFRLSSDHRIHVSVVVDGQGPLVFNYDTGADTCVITERGRPRLKLLAFKGREATLGLGGVTTHPVEPTSTVETGGYRRTNQKLMYIDYRGCFNAEGVLPYSAFSGRVVEVNYDELRIHVSVGKPDKVGTDPGMEVKIEDGLPFVDATISTETGLHTVPLAIDTGFSGPATFTYEDAERSGMPGNLHVYGVAQLGGTGSKAVRAVWSNFHESASEHVL